MSETQSEPCVVEIDVNINDIRKSAIKRMRLQITSAEDSSDITIKSRHIATGEWIDITHQIERHVMEHIMSVLADTATE